MAWCLPYAVMKHLLAVLLFAASIGFSQTSLIYPNFDLELGNLNNWTFSTAGRASMAHSVTGTPVNCTPPLSATSACSLLASITDTNVTGSISSCSITSTSPVPGRYIMYLKAGSGIATTMASYQFTVNALAPVLNLQCVHMLTGSESGLDGPFTQVMIKDMSNAVIPGSFMDYSVLTHSSVAVPYPGGYCLGWGTYSNNLTSYIGQTLKIEIVVSTCAYSGHVNQSWLDGYFSTVTGIKETDLSKPIQIVPNPANDFISIKKAFERSLNIKIYDVQGKIVRESNDEKIDISDLQKGIYFIRAIGENGNYSQSFIKE